ncbi:hypothetical protein MKY25_13905 [Geobacillus sp. FSL W8-0032]|uniref:hypothetical protein n=1 Tax=Geobacillus TaxID=129337 RepID=UPI00053B3C6A
MVRLFFYLVGFGFSVVGGMMAIAYLNLITPERGFYDYWVYIAKRPECYLLPIGLLFIWGSLSFPSRGS